MKTRKIFKQIVFGLLAVSLTAGFSSCKKDKTDDENNDALYSDILNNYIGTTIVPTYKSMAESALKMRTANEALKATPNDANMKAAADAWMEARIWWEKSEAFLFGPVGDQALDIDGHIDSWPLELGVIQAEIAKGAGTLDGKKAWQMDPEVIGFHVTEYLLFRDGKARPVSDLNAAELNYLTAATDALVWDCITAYVAWVGEENVPEEMKTVFHENQDVVDHLDNNPNYKNFGKRLLNGTGYPSLRVAMNEIAVGAAEIAGEVGSTKIQAPYEAHKVEDVESWYSWHSLDDYQNNIRSIKNAYFGGVDDNTRTTVNLSTFVKSKDAQLDADIKAKIEECLTKIYAIGGGTRSFYETVRDQSNDKGVEEAVTACLQLQTLFDKIADL